MTGAASEKCVVYPGDQPISGTVDPAAGTITLDVPRELPAAARRERRPTAARRETAATAGARFYDGTAFSFVNTTGADAVDSSRSSTTLDNTPAIDFLLPAGSAAATAAAATTGGTASSGGGGGGSAGAAPSSPAAAAATPAAQGAGTAPSQPSTGAVKGASKTVVTHVVSARGTVRAAAGTSTAQFVVTKTSVRYVDAAAKVRFASTKVSSVVVNGRTATLRGIGTSSGKRGVPFRVVLVAAKPATISVVLGRYVRTARVLRGSVVVR